ncbi:hypothetical protein NQ315_003485 [Exocentrus adspersus]|uniref:RNase H type-1 domain-containing protein n=1 Tax=Exocentrus adspersus TaxID=1586481 RepID=A0AAV8V4W8_9CUCU|nr:hypothetical protein NQ315_003485 [Exocentrus adspersus]
MAMLKVLYYGLCQSLLKYAIIAWGSAYKTTLKKIDTTQNILVRICLSKPFDYSTAHYKSIMNSKCSELSKYALLSNLSGSYTTVFQAEVFAILMVAQREDVKNCIEERIFICSDSQAALRAISSPRTRSVLVQECGDALSLARQKEVGLVWVRGHLGIPGNERADQLACLGSGKPP